MSRNWSSTRRARSTSSTQTDVASAMRVGRDLTSLVDQIRFAQFLLFRQAECLKAHAHANGVRLIGDLPFFVSPDSSDVWANPELFLLDARHRPRFVAGVPPDYFSAEGQLWGNPVYDWDTLRGTGYRWCIDRVRALLSHVDAIRLDHFRGFSAAWHVPAGAATARSGEWVLGPGASFFSAVKKELGRYRSSRKTSDSSHPTSTHSATSLRCPGPASSSSPSTAIWTIRTCQPTTSPTPSCTRAPTTTRRLAAGTRGCRRIGGRSSGTTCSGTAWRTVRLHRRFCVWPGRRWPRSPWLRCRTS